MLDIVKAVTIKPYTIRNLPMIFVIDTDILFCFFLIYLYVTLLVYKLFGNYQKILLKFLHENKNFI